MSTASINFPPARFVAMATHDEIQTKARWYKVNVTKVKRPIPREILENDGITTSMGFFAPPICDADRYPAFATAKPELVN